MDAEEREIYFYLKGWKNTFISAREICKRAGGKKKFQRNPDWAKPLLIRMDERGILETDGGGHYRLRAPKEKSGMKRWLSPQIATILKRGRGQISDISMSDHELDDYYDNL